MVNGTIAKTTNVGIIIIIIMCIVGIIILTINGKDIPGEISSLTTACIGFLVGTRFTPLAGNYTEKPATEVQPKDAVVVNESKPK